MKNRPYFTAILMMLMFTGYALCASPFSSSPAAVLRHDPNRPYSACVICLDTSLSPREDEFQRLLAIAQAIVQDEVTYNDLVWLIPIQSGLGPTQAFEMPAGSARRSVRSSRAAALAEAKAALLIAIRNMKQRSGTTDLQSSVEAALDLLRSHPNATRRLMVVGSDFLTDTGNGHVAIEPPQMSRAGSAAGVNALLLFTYPKPAYLQELKMSPSALLANVESEWTAYLNKNSASAVTILPADAVPSSFGIP